MAMIEKKNYTLRHVIMIICVIIILFPLVWLISTSIRRDNAAFSPNLFSNRVTLNNYKDLILQTPNVPEIINELNAISSYIGKYSDITVEEAIKISNNYIDQLEDYFSKTIQNFESVEKAYLDALSLYENTYKDKIYADINKLREEDYNLLQEELNNTLALASDLGINVEISELQSLINEYFLERKELLKSLENSSLNKESTYYLETMNTLLQIPLKTSTWRVRTYRRWINEEPEAESYGEDILLLEEKWKQIEEQIEKFKQNIQTQANNIYGETFNQISNYQTQLSNINSQISQISAQQSSLWQQNSKLFTSLTAIAEIFMMEKERVESSYLILKNYNYENVQGKEPLFGEDKLFYETVQKFASIMSVSYDNLNSIDTFIQNGFVETLELYSEVYKFLNDNFQKVFAIKDLTEISAAYQAIKTSTIKMSVSSDELVSLSTLYNENMEQLVKYSNQIEILREQRNEIHESLNIIMENSTDIINKISKIENIPYLLVTLEVSAQEITNNFEATNYASFMNSRYYTYFRPALNRYALMNWYNNFTESIQRFEQGREKLLEIQNKMNSNLNMYKNNLKEYLNLNFGGTTARILPLVEMQNLYNTQYGSASADIARASRLVSNLSNTTPYKELKNKLREIDKSLYLLQQDWSAKIRKPFMRWLLNSIIVAGTVAVLTVLMTSIGAYPFSRMRFAGRQQGLFFLMIIQMFPGVMFMIAIYGILKFMGDYFGILGLDSLDGLIFAYMGNVAYNMWLFKGYYDTIPDSLEESAMIDGATRFQTFWRIVLPLSLPIVAVVMILTFMNIFNEFVIARIILQSESNYTYAVGLQTFSTGPYETEWGLFTAASLLGAIPMVILFLCLQRWIIGGLTQGSVKG